MVVLIGLLQTSSIDEPNLLIQRMHEYCVSVNQELKSKDTSQSSSNASAFHESHVLYETKDFDESFKEINIVLSSVQEEDIKASFLCLLLKAEISFLGKGLQNGIAPLYKEVFELGTAFEVYPRLTDLALMRLGAAYLANEKYDSALTFFTIWEKEFMKKNATKKESEIFHNMGLCYYHLGSVKEAQNYLNRSLELDLADRDTLGISISYMDLGNLFYTQYKDNVAIPLFEKGFKYALLSKDLNTMIAAHQNMAAVEENRGNFKKALDYRKKYQLFKDSAWNRDRVWELAKQENKFRLDLKDNELALASERNLAQESATEAQTLRAQVFAAVSVLLAIISLISIWYYRNVRRSSKVIEGQREELLSLNAMKNKLFSIIAHDLKSPFTSIQRTQRKLSDAIENREAEVALQVMEQNKSAMDRTFRLLDNLLHWAQEQTDEIHFLRQPHRIESVLEQVVYDYQAVLQTRSICLKISSSSEHFVVVDANMIKVVLRNIIDNAIKFTKDGGQIDVSTKKLDSRVEIIVKDSGIGMSLEAQKKLFIGEERSSSGEDVYGKKSSGLGMILSKGLVEKNGGTIDVTSQLTKGTSFFIYLPQSEKEQTNG